MSLSLEEQNILTSSEEGENKDLSDAEFFLFSIPLKPKEMP